MCVSCSGVRCLPSCNAPFSRRLKRLLSPCVGYVYLWPEPMRKGCGRRWKLLQLLFFSRFSYVSVLFQILYFCTFSHFFDLISDVPLSAGKIEFTRHIRKIMKMRNGRKCGFQRVSRGPKNDVSSPIVADTELSLYEIWGGSDE